MDFYELYKINLVNYILYLFGEVTNSLAYLTSLWPSSLISQF